MERSVSALGVVGNLGFQVSPGSEVPKHPLWRVGDAHLPGPARLQPDAKRDHAERAAHRDVFDVGAEDPVVRRPPRPMPGPNGKSFIVDVEQPEWPWDAPPACDRRHSVGPLVHSRSLPERPIADSRSPPAVARVPQESARQIVM